MLLQSRANTSQTHRLQIASPKAMSPRADALWRILTFFCRSLSSGAESSCRTGLLLACDWLATGLLLACYWCNTGPDQLQGCCVVRGYLSSNNTRESWLLMGWRAGQRCASIVVLGCVSAELYFVAIGWFPYANAGALPNSNCQHNSVLPA